MKSTRYRQYLIFGFALIIVVAILLSLTGALSIKQTSELFHHTYNDSFAQLIEVEKANANLIAIHRAMKDIVLSNNDSIQFQKAFNDFNIYDIQIKENFNRLSKFDPENPILKDVIKAYEEWEPIRTKTMEYTLKGEFDLASDNTKTIGAAQVNLISGKMQILINYHLKESQVACEFSQTNSQSSLKLLLWLTVATVLLTIIISVYIIRKLSKNEFELQNEKEKLRITFESIGDGVVTTDTNRNIVKLNKVAEELSGWKSEDVVGKQFSEVFDIISEITGEKAKDPIEEVLTTDKICELENHAILTAKDGTKRHIADSAAPIKDKFDNTTGVVMVFRDVTEKKESIEKIKYLSFHDSLTGLNNRAFFEAKLKELDNEANYPISIIMGDVNGLKLSNDVYGHESGDSLLKNIACILIETCGENSIVARYGGDEFVVILPNTPNDRVNEICENIKISCEKCNLKPIILSIALGASTKDDASTEINTTLKNAEDRMYNHKLVESKSVRSTIISSLQKTLFERSCETEEHAVRMMELANKFGSKIHLSQYEMDEMKLITLLHDVGKIGIPDSLLNKPGKLTIDEWLVMKKHPEIGYRIAQSTSELAHISELILTHHEHWDGGGYPQGLKGQDIPKLSRILSIIDTYDVMTHKRPYKEPVSEANALEEIKRCAGTQFDPYLVEDFIKIIA